ncbi:MAG: RNA polymerase sigma factor [Acidobacteriia bacterium]|nr:RNA polymerase sigma factor [Terriglobia bacterium]
MDHETELVRRCLAADAAAWEALLQTHTRKIYNLCYRFTGRPAEAEDLTQEVFIKVFQTLRTFDPAQAAFGVWLNRVARNHLVDHYRRTKRDRATSSLDDALPAIEEKSSPVADATAQVESRERRELLQRALERLSPDLREAVVLRDLQDLDYDEIAQVLAVPVGTVKSRINRGRLELARVLKRMEQMKGPAKAGGQT